MRVSVTYLLVFLMLLVELWLKVVCQICGVCGHSRLEWAEIAQPFTGEKMFANLTTGECTWMLPAGMPV